MERSPKDTLQNLNVSAICSIVLLYSEKMNEHDDEINGLDILYEHGLILSSSVEGMVKVWNSKKELIRSIKFNEEITQAMFLNDQADIVVGHGGQLSIIYAKDYQPFENTPPSMQDVKGKIAVY